MAVTLRLARHGRKKRPFYRVVAAEKESPRDGRFLEIVGYYNPITEPPEVSLKEDRVRRWVAAGAQTTRVVRDLINRQIPGMMAERQEAQRKKLQEQRRKRKERMKARGVETRPRKEKKKRTKKAAQASA